MFFIATQESASWIQPLDLERETFYGDRSKSRRDLDRAAQLVSWLNRPAVDHIVVLLPGLDRFERHRSAKTLKFLFNDCGCIWGAPAFVATFSYVLATHIQANGFSWSILGYSFGIGFCVALVAKLVGLAWSYWRLKVWFERMMSVEAEMEVVTQEVKS